MDTPMELNEYLTKIYFRLHYKDQGQISHKNIRILQLLDKKENVGIGDVAAFFKISPNTASENIKRLVKVNYIKKEKSETDERKVYIRLTELGRKVLVINTCLDEEKLAAIFDHISEQKRKAIIDGFRLLNIESEKMF